MKRKLEFDDLFENNDEDHVFVLDENGELVELEVDDAKDD